MVLCDTLVKSDRNICKPNLHSGVANEGGIGIFRDHARIYKRMLSMLINGINDRQRAHTPHKNGRKEQRAYQVSEEYCVVLG